jgi:hypothetical protein
MPTYRTGHTQAAIQAVRTWRYLHPLGIAHGPERRPHHDGEQLVTAQLHEGANGAPARLHVCEGAGGR